MTLPTSGSTELDRALLSLLVTVIVAIGRRVFESKPRVRWAVPHQNAFMQKPKDAESYLINTQTIRVENYGRVKAEKVEVHEDKAITAKGAKFRHMVHAEAHLNDGTVLKRTTTAPRSSSEIDTGHWCLRVTATAQGRPASTTIGSLWKPELSDPTSALT